jgi:glycosyltransferase involved in cell wall biosynthesis
MAVAKKLLFLSNRGLLPIKDGHTRRSFNILKGLAGKKQVYFLSLYETQEEVSPENIQALKSICHQVEFLPAPPKTLSCGMILRLLRSIISRDAYTVWRHYSKPFMKRVDKLISSGQFDLVHCDILPISYTVRDTKNIFRSVTDHDVSYLKCISMAKNTRNVFQKLFFYLESRKLKRLERNIFSQVDLGIVVSESDKNALQALCPEGKFLVVENGVELEKFTPSSEPQIQNKLLWLGGFGHFPNKQGIRYFLAKVYPLVKDIVPKASIDIVGGGVTEDLRRLSFGDSSINFVGFVDDPLPYLHQSMVFVAPILSGGGTKLKVLEAMAAGKAIVCTSVGCEGIAGVDMKHYIVSDDVQGFADAVITLLRDEQLRTSIQENARKLAISEYDFEHICERLNSYYSDNAY